MLELEASAHGWFLNGWNNVKKSNWMLLKIVSLQKSLMADLWYCDACNVLPWKEACCSATWRRFPSKWERVAIIDKLIKRLQTFCLHSFVWRFQTISDLKRVSTVFSVSATHSLRPAWHEIDVRRNGSRMLPICKVHACWGSCKSGMHYGIFEW